MNLKDSNPKDAVGVTKVPLSVVSQVVLGELALAKLEGALKYGRHNYRRAGIRASVYFDAAWRHLAAWWEGQDLDPDSGLSHVTKAIASLFILRDSMIRGNWRDDRPPKVSSDWVKGLNAVVTRLRAKYPDARPSFTEVAAKVQRPVEISLVPWSAVKGVLPRRLGQELSSLYEVPPAEHANTWCAVARDLKRVVGVTRFYVDGPEAYDAGTVVVKSHQGMGIAKQLWRSLIAEFAIQDVEVYPATEQGAQLCAAVIRENRFVSFKVVAQ